MENINLLGMLYEGRQNVKQFVFVGRGSCDEQMQGILTCFINTDPNHRSNPKSNQELTLTLH